VKGAERNEMMFLVVDLSLFLKHENKEVVEKGIGEGDRETAPINI